MTLVICVALIAALNVMFLPAISGAMGVPRSTVLAMEFALAGLLLGASAGAHIGHLPSWAPEAVTALLVSAAAVAMVVGFEKSLQAQQANQVLIAANLETPPQPLPGEDPELARQRWREWRDAVIASRA